MRAVLIVAVGATWVVAGAAFIYWPVALILAGVAVAGFGLLHDFGDVE